MLRASLSCALLVAEGANRVGTGEKRQRYSLARGELGECAAALELAGRLGLAAPLEVAAALALADRVGGMLTRLVARFGG
jgi:four helix bundle protein